MEKTVKNFPVIFNKEFADFQTSSELRKKLSDGSILFGLEQYKPTLTQINDFIEQDEDVEPILCERCGEELGYYAYYNDEPEDPLAFKLPSLMHTDQEKPTWTFCKSCYKEIVFFKET